MTMKETVFKDGSLSQGKPSTELVHFCIVYLQCIDKVRRKSVSDSKACQGSSRVKSYI